MFYYDKPVYLSCIVYLPAYKGYADEVIKSLEETYSAKPLLYPSDFVPEVIKDMSENGYPKFKNLPLTLSCEESLVILTKYNPSVKFEVLICSFPESIFPDRISIPDKL